MSREPAASPSQRRYRGAVRTVVLTPTVSDSLELLLQQRRVATPHRTVSRNELINELLTDALLRATEKEQT